MSGHGRGPVARVIVGAISLYRTAVSPLRPPSCRFSPTCSAYALEAVDTWGAGRGCWLALRRLSRCHPFHRGGVDPVPSRRPDGVQSTDRTAPALVAAAAEE